MQVFTFWQDFKLLWQDFMKASPQFSLIKFISSMSHFIWFDHKNERYRHGTSIDLKVNESVAMSEFDVLYELGAEERYLVEKITLQLNNARAASRKMY